MVPSTGLVWSGLVCGYPVRHMCGGGVIEMSLGMRVDILAALYDCGTAQRNGWAKLAGDDRWGFSNLALI